MPHFQPFLVAHPHANAADQRRIDDHAQVELAAEALLEHRRQLGQLRFVDREEAQQARPRALVGESFDGLAAAGIGERRGWSRTALVTRGSGQLDPDIEEELFSLPDNGVSEPFVGHDGAVYLARLLRRQQGSAELDRRRAEAQATTLLTDKREGAAKQLRADLFREDKVQVLYEGMQAVTGAGCADFADPCAKREVLYRRPRPETGHWGYR